MEMDAYCVSKIYADWTALGKTAITTPIDMDNVLQVFDDMMVEMSDERVPATGRILYVTPQVGGIIRMATDRGLDIRNGSTNFNTLVTSINQVQIVEVSSELMKTLYDFTVGWAPAATAKQIHMFLVHPLAVITPTKYQFAQLDPPAAMSDGKWVYYEESYEDAFILNNKATAIKFVTAP